MPLVFLLQIHVDLNEGITGRWTVACSCTCYTTRNVIKPGSHIPLPYLRRSRRLQLTTMCFSRSQVNLRWTADALKFARILIEKIVLLEYFASADDAVHIKYFHRRQSWLAYEVELGSSCQCLGQIMIQRSHIICRNGVPGRVSQVNRRHMRTRLNPR